MQLAEIHVSVYYVVGLSIPSTATLSLISAALALFGCLDRQKTLMLEVKAWPTTTTAPTTRGDQTTARCGKVYF